MTKSALESQWIRRTRWLTQALILSGTLNIGFLATFIYTVLREKEKIIPLSAKPHSQEQKKNTYSNEKVLRAYSLLPYPELLTRLENREPGEDGYLRRDFALACLVSFHHFNLERALGGLEVQKREIRFASADGAEQIPLLIYPGLADYQYEAIIHYAKTEKWPLSAQGLFFEVQRSRFPRDTSLLEAFYLTPQFHTLATFFVRSGIRLEKEALVEMFAKGDWNLLCAFAEGVKRSENFSPDTLRALLVKYLEQRSPIAAKLLLLVDQEFVAKRLLDSQLLPLFDLLPENTPFLDAVAKEVLTSPRSNALWKKAALLLALKAQGRVHPGAKEHIYKPSSQSARAP